MYALFQAHITTYSKTQITLQSVFAYITVDMRRIIQQLA